MIESMVNRDKPQTKCPLSELILLATKEQRKLPQEAILTLDIEPIQNHVYSNELIQSIIKKLTPYNLGVHIPHFHPRSEEINFAHLPEGWVQVRQDNKVTFLPIKKLAEVNHVLQPISWRFHNSQVKIVEYGDIASVNINSIPEIENMLAVLSEYMLGVTVLDDFDRENSIQVEESCGEIQNLTLQPLEVFSAHDVADSAVIWTSIGNKITAAARCCDPQRLGHRQNKH
jgi:hypothetical protein